jgi:tellurite resistance protein TerC
MLAQIEISGWDWTIFVAAILVFLALDLGVFHRKAHVVGFREAFIWTAIWFVVAICFGLFIAPEFVEKWGKEEKAQFITGYIIELSLSMDNVFVIALIFAYFGVGLQFQHRVLFWGILGALLMRGLMIWMGAELISRFHWMIYVFGGFLVFTGIKMLAADDNDDVEPEKNPAVRLARKFFPISPSFDGSKFMTIHEGKKMLTPLALVLLMVETTDVIFAVDSIPAIFAVTQDPFIVFTSNVFAILGLRSLYFVLAGAIDYFRFLKVGLSIVLVFIGAKMLINPWYHIDTTHSLIIVAGIIGGSILISLLVGKKKAKKE